ncbi:hypothetical protein ACCT24_24185 [Rhizobium ruizarguesonis]|jgi:hypothetical protein|uniref:hypothetical protein n=1 Tax=Rhizobium ruizarguesonis TaxID=2081791 RepID=UPI001FE18899
MLKNHADAATGPVRGKISDGQHHLARLPLANIFVIDEKIVRYADDFVMGFENKDDAEEVLLAL